MKESHAAASASESTTPALRYFLISVPRSAMECNGHDPCPAQRCAEPVDAAVLVCSASDVGIGIETRVIRPQLQVAAGNLHVHLARARKLLHPLVPEGIAERDFTQTRVRAVFETRAHRTAGGALSVAERARVVVEPAFADHIRRARARTDDRTVDHITRLVMT